MNYSILFILLINIYFKIVIIQKIEILVINKKNNIWIFVKNLNKNRSRAEFFATDD